MKSTLRVLVQLTVIISMAALLGLGCGSNSGSKVSGDKMREFANDLYNRELFKQAIEQYKIYLSDYNVGDKEQANINYIIGDIYFDRLKDYENALTFYLKVKHFYPETSLTEEINKKVVACLERLDRSVDAQQALKETTSLDPGAVAPNRPGEVIARIGNRNITMGDLNFEINQLPPNMRQQFSEREKKLEFLNQYLTTEMLFNTAKREGLDNDKDVLDQAFQAKKRFMVYKLLEQRVAQNIQTTDTDLQLYYEANKDKYTEKDKDGNVLREKSLAEVRDQVARDYYQKRYLDESQRLIGKMMEAESVQIFEDKIQ